MGYDKKMMEAAILGIITIMMCLLRVAWMCRRV